MTNKYVPPPTPVRPPLIRPRAGRILGGVCAGLALHLDAPRQYVRWGFVLGIVLLSPILYLWLWIFVPSAEKAAQAAAHARATGDTGRLRLARSLDNVSAQRRPTERQRWFLAACALLAGAGLIGVYQLDFFSSFVWSAPVLLGLVGVGLTWWPLQQRPGLSRWRIRDYAVLGGGIVTIAVAVLVAFSRLAGISNLLWNAGVVALVLLALSLVLAPVWMRLIRDLGASRAQSAREAERADIAAHLHDSVLQTLALLRSRAEDPAQVRALARRQERELRDWLYSDRPAGGGSAAGAIKGVAAEVEDLYGVEIEVVIVGDCAAAMTEAAPAATLVAATREALANAARHASGPYSLYAELTGRGGTVFVRDRGPGFDLKAIAPDRHGVRESIQGRLQRAGGEAHIKTGPEGTEVIMRVEP